MKMKMAARKGSGAGLPPEDPSSLISGPPSLAPAVAEEERPTGG
jgi:hypothetical protein